MFACMSYNQWLRTVWKWCFCCCFRSLAYNYVQHSYGSFLCQDIFSDRFFFSHFPIILVTLIYGYGNFFIDKRGFIQVVKSHCEIVNIKIGEMYWNVAIFWSTPFDRLYPTRKWTHTQSYRFFFSFSFVWN